MCLCRFSSLAVTAEWMVLRPSCLHCRFLTLASGELQSGTGTGHPFLAEERPAVLAVPVSACCDGHQSTVHGEGRATLPRLLRPQFQCTLIPHSSRYLLLWCSELTAGKSAGTWLSQNCLHHNDSSFQSPSTSSCWPFCNLNCQTHEGRSSWGYLDTQGPAALWSSDSSAYWFLFVIQCRRAGIPAAVKTNCSIIFSIPVWWN